MNQVRVVGTHLVDVTIEDSLTPDEALALASELITASNVANGITPTGIFA